MTDTRPIKNCTAVTPKPKQTPDTEVWYHHGSAPIPDQPPVKESGDRRLWKCPHCLTEFWVTAGKFGGIKAARQKVAKMRERGWRRS